MAEGLQVKFQEVLRSIHDIDRRLKDVLTNRQVLDSQLKENEQVAQELKLLDSEAVVYKMVGSILLKQEPAEATSNVSKRLDFIKTELGKTEEKIKELETKAEDRQRDLMDIQHSLQSNPKGA